ncbi:hypothetical protein EUX98_g9632 [Antrodiella citrinella]|uniref:Fungal-type protein kinase domain-containing protein n=1 Tax=Antrodiella citrinella TaxID=2447956 RepID=A0A4S4LPM4_9APHY|nr:hypothetical protein EUX98_g9632 [Antrodiella citrinella]
MIERAGDVHNLVLAELGLPGRSHVANTNDFLEKLLLPRDPLLELMAEPDTQSTLNRLRKAIKTPLKLVEGAHNEKAMYNPLMEMGDSVPERGDDKLMSKVRPDGVCVSHTESSKPLSSVEEDDTSSVWWSRIETPVEVKPGSSETEKNAGIKQLAVYMRQALRTQPNRLFIFGLLLCRNELRVCLCDRSGLVVTEDWINITAPDDHEFQKLVQTIAGLSCLPMEHLGWDMSMCLLLKATHPGKWVFACDNAMANIDDIGKNVYSSEWAISIPAEDPQQGAKWYLTRSAISLTKAEVMVGRATIVWQVKELRQDMKGFLEASCAHFVEMDSPKLTP